MNELPAVDVPLSPHHFLGRRSVIDPICNRLRQHELLSSQAVGGPKSGKTSLLRYLASELADEALAEAASMIRIYVDAAALGSTATPAQFWMLACREIKSSPAVAALVTQHPPLGDALAQVIEKARAGGLDIFYLLDVFDAFADLKRPLLLLVDEFDSVIANPHFLPPADFFNQLRSLGDRRPRGLAFVVTTARPLSDVGAAAAGASPPYNQYVVVPMDPLSEDEIRAQLDAFAACRGIAMAPDAWRLVAKAARGHPMLTSHLTCGMVEAVCDGRAFDEAALSAMIGDPDGPFARLNQSIMAALTARERLAVQSWLADPSTVTEQQRSMLQRLAKYALLPPGIEL